MSKRKIYQADGGVLNRAHLPTKLNGRNAFFFSLEPRQGIRQRLI